MKSHRDHGLNRATQSAATTTRHPSRLALRRLAVGHYESLVIAAATDASQRRLLGDVLHQVANALQETIGACRQLRDEGQLTTGHAARLDAPIARAVGALRKLQPPSAAVFASDSDATDHGVEGDHLPLTLAELKAWILQKHQLPAPIQDSLLRAIERILHELTDRSQRDPKTQLVNFKHFMHQLESFLALEQQGRWCAVGLADVNAFKHYNDTLGHLPGDRILERVATLLREHVRSNDLLAQQSGDSVQDLHGRFGGDEFCFLISNLSEPSHAYAIADRFRSAVSHENWSAIDDRLAGQPIRVDVGVACLWLGDIEERRKAAGRLSASLLERADALMYEAKACQSTHIHGKATGIANGVLVDLATSDHLTLPGHTTHNDGDEAPMATPPL